MAILKGIGYNTTTAKTSTGSSTDTVNFDTNVEIDGDLSVQGDIQSRSTSSLLVQDNFIDLNQGNDAATSLPGGYTLQVAASSGFTSKVITAFTAAVAQSSGTSGGALSVDTVPANGESITLQSLCIKGNVTQTISFVNSGGTETTFGQSVANTLKIDITASNTNTLVAAAIKAGFDNSLRTQKGLTLFNAAALSGTGNKTVTFTSSIGNLTIANINITDNTGGNLSGVTDGNSNGNPAFFTSASGTSVSTGDIVDVHTSDDASNDGLYGIAAVSSNDHFIVPTVGINDSVKFLKSTFAASTESTSNCKAYVPSLYVQIVASGDAAIVDGGGSTIAEGTLADAFDATADFDSFSSYTIVGAGTTTLQDAYDAGNTITTSGGQAVALTLSNGGMTVATSSSNNFATSGAGTSTLATTSATAGAITLSTNGGVGETIALTNTQGNTNAAIDITASAGGVDIDAATSVFVDATTDIQLTATGVLSLDLNTSGTGNAKYAMMSLKASEALTDGNIVKLVAPTNPTSSLEVTNNGNLVANSSTITLQKADNSTVVFTAKASGATGNEFNIGADAAATATNIFNAINANSDFNASSGGGAVVNISLVTFGTAGNGKTVQTNQANAIGNIANSGTFAGAENTRIAKAQADSSANATVFGIVDAAVTSGQNGVVYGEGSYISASGLSFTGDQVGSIAYLSDSAAGGVSVTPPSGSGDVVFEVGLVVDTNAIVFRPRFVMEIG